jgi:hypothetical protein
MKNRIYVVLAGVMVLMSMAGLTPAEEGSGGGGLRVDYAWFCPDKPLPYKYRWWEGFGEFWPEHSVQAGSFHVYLANGSDDSVRVSRMYLNDTPLERLHDDLRVGWWRTMPNPIPAGGMAEVIVRLKHPLEGGSAVLRLDSDRGPVTCEVRLNGPRIEIGYVSFSPDLDRVYLYVEKYTDDPITLTRTWLNGREVTAATTFHPAYFFRSLSLVEIALDRPLREGDRPILKVAAMGGEVAETKVRAWPSDFFTLGAFGLVDSMDTYPDFHLNTSLTFAGDIHRYYLEQLVEYGYQALPGGDDNANYYYDTKDIESVQAYFFFDEPDGKDHPGNLPAKSEVAKFRRLKEMDGLGSMALLMEEYAERVRYVAPDKGTFMIINQTYKPDNYFMYGKIPDIPAPDIYPHTTGEDPYTIYQMMNAARLASMPRPFYSVPDFVQQAFSRYYWERTVDVEELDLRVLYSVAAGAKGLIWYCFDGSLQWTPEVETRMKELNGRLEIAGPVLEIGHPVPDEWGTAGGGKLMVRTLLCGPETLVVTLINTNYQATAEGFSYEAIPDATVRVTLPPDTEIAHCFAAHTDTSVSFPFQVDGNELVIEAGRVETGGFLICTGDAELEASLRGRWDTLVAHRLAVRERRRAAFDQKLANVKEERYRVAPDEVLDANDVSGLGLWNPLDEENNALQWTSQEAGEKKGVTWRFTIADADVPHVIGLHLLGRTERSGGNTFDLYLKDAAGEVVKTDAVELASVHGAGGRFDYTPKRFPFEWDVTFPAAGEYTLELRQGKLRHKFFPSTAQVARYIYVRPKAE